MPSYKNPSARCFTFGLRMWDARSFVAGYLPIFPRSLPQGALAFLKRPSNKPQKPLITGPLTAPNGAQGLIVSTGMGRLPLPRL